MTSKVKSIDELSAIVAGERAQGRGIVWANGCFEILHAGHIEFLLKAASLGDKLIVGVNSDESVAALKGQGHPLAPVEERVLVLGAVACVDYITVFDAPTCAEMLQTLKPDVFAKGLKHLHGGINEEERGVVESYGGCLALIAGDPLHSTTSIIAKVRAGR